MEVPSYFPPATGLWRPLASSAPKHSHRPVRRKYSFRFCQVFFLLLILLAAFCVCTETLSTREVHKRMTQDDLRRIFNVDSHEDVPEYDITHVRSIRKRDATQSSTEDKQIHLTAFGRNLRLNLERNREFHGRLRSFKVYTAESTENGVTYHEVPPEDDDEIGTPYHDQGNLAAVLLRHDDNGKVEIEGTIGNNLVVKPAPAYLVTPDEFVDDEMFLDEDEEYERWRNTTTSAPASRQRNSARTHIVYHRLNNGTEATSDYLPLEWGEVHNITRQSHRITKRQAPDTVWPEILLVVDYQSFQLHSRDSNYIKRYFVSFWNGVDLRYKLLIKPKIRVSLAGMVVAKNKQATPYLEQNRLPRPNHDAIDAAAALTDMGKYLYREDRLPKYDMAVVITKLDMCRRQYDGGRCSRGTAGFAYVGGACVVNKRLEKVNSVAIIEDSGGFSGIIVAAHEVGHLLGCVHDGSPAPSYLGGPGAARCPWEEGYIMSDLRHTDRGFQWSSCSVEQFKHFLNGETAACLYNYPLDNKLLPQQLPGTMMSLDEQCRMDRGTQACFKDARVCAQLFCYDSSSGYCVSFRPAAEGSICGDGQVCKSGRCIIDNENIIPDYTHVTRSIANRADRNQGPTKSAATRPTAPPAYSRPTTSRLLSHRRTTSAPVQRRTSLAPLQRRTSSPLPISRTTSSSNNDCEDGVQHLAGGLTCKDFLQRYGFRYCKHNYMKQNCCASQRAMCDGKY